MHGYLKLIRQENLTGRLPAWCGVTEAEDHARWCFDPATVVVGTITLGEIATAAALVGTAVSAVGAVQQGRATQASLDYQAAVDRQRAERERQEAAVAEEDFRRQQSALMAKRRANLGVSGVEATTGSPLLVSEDFAGEIELQALRIRNQGEVGATRLEQQATLNRAQGRAARTAGYTRAGSLLLSGAGTAFGRR